MTDAELLAKVKIGLFGEANTTWRDNVLTVYIDEVKGFMRNAGVPETVLSSDASAGCIMLGVNDLWNYSSGGVKLSEYFKQRVIQLTAGGESNAQT